jgi:hypothetical protein
MKIIAKFNDMYYTEDNEVIVSFKTNNFQSKARFKEMDKNVAYSIDFKPVPNKRTENQNKYFWALVGELANAINGDNDINSIYCNILEKFSNNFTTLLAPLGSQQILVSNFRAVKLVTTQEVNGKRLGVFQCYEGSSKFSKKEMMLIIDGALLLAADAGLDLVYWREVLYVKETKET